MENTKIKIKFSDLTPRELVEGFESIYLYRNQDNDEMMVEYAARCKNDFVYCGQTELDSELCVDKRVINPELHSLTNIKDMTLRDIIKLTPKDEFGDVYLDEEYWFDGQCIRVRYYGD